MDLNLPDLTPAVIAAVARMPRGRTAELVTFAQVGEDPGELTADETTVYAQAVANVAANPGVIWDRLDG